MTVTACYRFFVRRHCRPALGALLLLGALPLGAATPSLKPQYSASMGSVTLGEEQFYRLCFRPDIPIGKWGVALDVELFIDNRGRISARGWDLGTSTQAVDTFLRKVYYVRYGQPQDKVYAKFGALDQITLGYGLIMNRYRNTLQYPAVKKTGVHFQLRDLGLEGLDVEGVLNNLQDLQQGGPLLGLRVSHQPMDKLEVGLTYVVDLDQYGGLLDSDGDGYPDAVDAFPRDKKRALDNDGDGVTDALDSDDDNNGVLDADPGSGLPEALRAELNSLQAAYGDSVFPVDQQVDRKRPFNKKKVGKDRFGVLGLDAAYSLVEGSRLDLKLYGQMALYTDDSDSLDAADLQGVTPGNHQAKGFGLVAPGVWMKMGPVGGQLEFRYFQDDFAAGYFDDLYDVDRVRLDVATGKATPKDARLVRAGHQAGVYGSATTDLGGMVETSADYQYLAGADDPQQQLHASASLSPRLLESIPRLKAARAYYQKNNIGTRDDGFFDSTEDTFYGYAIGLEMASGVTILWDTRFLFARGADLQLERQKVMSIETLFNF